MKEIKLIHLQWKILHNIFPTNIILKKIGLRQSEICDFCDENDVVEHTFFRCKRLKSFWKNISTRLINKLNKNITLNEVSIMLGVEQTHQELNVEEKSLINKISIIGKLSIIKNKINKTPIELIFERELRLRKIEF